ncbi:MAG TPA: NADH-ubiquinone oxidoreductase-F iron-sulfur binding region domain-containing protein, partial [Ktedonobacterales bacterium]|nr:NADH-ubiquinone oxidoreductase-F iron-sulfur binding region domain-containing protein [Ktedonobacterales bacterium]
AYRKQGGYEALRQALGGPTPEQVIGEIRNAGLRGRGGAGYSAGDKLAMVAGRRATTRYLIVNAYDADARSLVSATILERNPHLVLEGLALAAYAAGVSEAFLYMRSTRTAAAEAAQKAISDALEKNLLGRNILGTTFSLAVTVVGVDRSFMGGEESTLIEIIKGRPMKAQQRPPYPATNGLYDQPTAVLNIETLANLPAIISHGADAFRRAGSAATPGTKLLTVIGPEGARLAEIPFGATIRQALRQAGLDANESNARGVVVGGMEGGVLPLSALDTVFDYDPLLAAGAMVGSGMIEVLPVDACMARWAMERSDYLAAESCGKCVPCRVGVKRVAGTLQGLVSGLGQPDDLKLLEEFSHYIPDGSLCGFGVHAAHPVVTAMRYFGDDFAAHLAGRCPTGTCEPVRAHRYTTKHVL